MDVFQQRLFSCSFILIGLGILFIMGVISIPFNGIVTDDDCWFLSFIFGGTLLLFFLIYEPKEKTK